MYPSGAKGALDDARRLGLIQLPDSRTRTARTLPHDSEEPVGVDFPLQVPQLLLESTCK